MISFFEGGRTIYSITSRFYLLATTIELLTNQQLDHYEVEVWSFYLNVCQWGND